MNQFRLIVLSLTALLIFAASQLSSQSNNDIFYPGQLWVQFDPGYTKSVNSDKKSVDRESIIKLIGEELAQTYDLIEVEKPFYFARTNDIREVYKLSFNSTDTELEIARLLESLPSVNYAERVPVMRPTYTPNDLGPQGGGGNQWGLWQINAQQAWDISTGNTEIKVAIVDDAVLTTHPDLIPNLVPGYDVADEDNDPMPNEVAMSHGTHVAGIVSAATDNNLGVASIGFNVKIMPVKSSNVPTTITDAYAGVVWAADNDADVINMSWGGSGFSQTGQNIINYAFNEGCVNIAASGNDNVSTVFYPAGYNNVVSVSSTTTNDVKSNFSNYGDWVDVSAPGSQILSTYIGGGFQPTYNSISGTSMASPMVAGLAGLILSVNPELPQAQVVDCLVETADNIDVANPSFIGQLGSGRINAYEAVLCAQATVNAPPIAVVNSDNALVCPGGLVQYYGSSSGGLATTYEWTFPGGNPATSNIQNPVVAYSGEGIYDVSLTVTNDFGTNSITQEGYVEVSTNGTDVFYSEDFESGTLEGNGFSIDNPDNGITWGLNTVGGSVVGNKAAGINLFNYDDPGQRDGLITPSIDLSNHYNVQLDFQHAHRRYSADYSDSLIVYVSTDGGTTFPNRVLEVSETGQGTFATGTILAENFIPANGSDWCFGGDLGSACFTIDLSEFDGESDVRIKFETYNDYGNNIYVDNIELSGNCLLVQAAPVADFTALPLGICAGETVQFTDQSNNVPTSYEWFFEGGTPATSTLVAPEITYNETGSYTVTLVVTNAFGTDELTQENYVVVGEAPTVSVSDTEVSVCQGEAATLIASGADSYQWSPDIALSSTTDAIVEASPAASLTYTLTGYANGCAVSETINVNVLPAPQIPEIVSQNDVAFTVLNPAGISGYYPYSPATAGQGWGTPAIGSVSVEAPLVIARDNSAADSLLCNAPVNGAEINGSIAVVYRGDCQFGQKALNAQNAGAVGVIIVNNVPGELMDMGGGNNGPQVDIPTVMVTAETGAWLNAEINLGFVTAVLGQFNGGGLIICPEETMRLAAPGGWGSYEWSTGDEEALVEINSTGTYTVDIIAENGCASSSESVVVSMYAVTEPVIEPDGTDGLAVNNVNATEYQWYLNGELIPGANGSSIEIISNGIYTVEIIDNNGCASESDPYEVAAVSVAELNASEISVYPVPARDIVTIEVESDVRITRIVVFSADGRKLDLPVNNYSSSDQIQLDISSWASGTYFIQLSDSEQNWNVRIVKAN